MYQRIENTEQFEKEISNNDLVLAYFSGDTCNVCKVLKPQISAMVSESFSKIKLLYVDIAETPEIASQQMVFTMPTIVVYAIGKETVRKSRYIGIEELRSVLERLYKQIVE